MYRKYCLFIAASLITIFSSAQNYQAIHGSMYAGSLAPANNPASILHVPFNWDVTVFSAQAKQSTNAFTLKNFSLFSPSPDVIAASVDGTRKRFLFANQDVHLFNARFKLKSKSAIAFGGNIRSYQYITTNIANYQDTIRSLRGFLGLNQGNQPLSGQGVGSSWLEGYFTYSRTLKDDGEGILNGGITVKANRNLGGGYARAQDLRYTTTVAPDGSPVYTLTDGSLQYGYSYNFDFINANNSTRGNAKNFLLHAYNSFSFDVGLEYILQDIDDNDEEADEFTYSTKIGISLMDIGGNKFRHSRNSGAAFAGKAGITDKVLEDKFSNIESATDFKDSLVSIANSFIGTVDNFVVYQPTRLIINADHYFSNNIYVNAELTLPFISLASSNTLYIKDMNLLAVTPRWETKSFGVYMPVLLNIRKQLWVGGAFKAGPFLLGVHNLANLFSKNKIQNGGGYIAFTIRPGRSFSREGGDAEKLNRQQRKNLDCPKF